MFYSNVLRKASGIFGKRKSNSPHSHVQAPCIQEVPDNTNPSCDTLPSIPLNSPTKDIPRNILAFRTITKLLSRIQQERAFQFSHLDSKLPTEQRLELEVSSAFSTVAVIEHEVVAVVTNRNHETLKIIACVQSSNNNPHVKPSSPPSARLMYQGSQLLVAQNHRRSDLQRAILPTGEPTITDARILADLVDDEAIKLYVQECWSHSTLTKHLWILSKLLTVKEPSTDGPKRDPTALVNHLLPYVVATCYPKMRRRLKHRTLSQLYIQSLKEVTTFQFDESKRDEPSRNEIANDRIFLVKYFLPLASMSNTKKKRKTPKLIEQAQLAHDAKPFRLYTEDTCVEFHQLLLDILIYFERSLDELAKARGTEQGPTQGSDKFKEKVTRIIMYGHGLQILARCAGLKMHLKTITPLLRNGILRSKMSTSIPEPGEEQEELELELELDEDLEAVQPFISKEGVETPLWTSYVDWLRLMIVHLDAVDILVEYVTGPHFNHEAISIQILVAPPVDQRLLPWRELFTDSTLFPTHTIPDSLSAIFKPNANITNAGILEFLNKALETFSEAKAARAMWNKKDVSRTIESFEKLESFNLPGWEECAKKTLVKLRGLDSRLPDDDLFLAISNEIQLLCENATFLTSLGDEQGFSGTLHCEACLASLFNETTTASKDILAQMTGFGPFIGVSKRCCQICQYLLSLLGNRKFIVRGFHDNVTACTLPTWLPGHIVDSMNEYVGAQLRRELLELIDRSELFRNRAQSRRVRRLSSDSTESSDDNCAPQ